MYLSTRWSKIAKNSKRTKSGSFSLDADRILRFDHNVQGIKADDCNITDESDIIEKTCRYVQFNSTISPYLSSDLANTIPSPIREKNTFQHCIHVKFSHDRTPRKGQ